MSRKITLIEYLDDVYDGDDMEPDITLRQSVNSGVGGKTAEDITDKRESNRRILKTNIQLADLHDYIIGISSSSSLSSSSSSCSPGVYVTFTDYFGPYFGVSGAYGSPLGLNEVLCGGDLVTNIHIPATYNQTTVVLIWRIGSETIHTEDVSPGDYQWTFEDIRDDYDLDLIVSLNE